LARTRCGFYEPLRACLKMGRGSVWERRVRLARREEGADPQRSVTDKQRRQRALPSQTLRAAGGARFESAELREAHGPDRHCREIGCLLTPSAHRPVISADRVNRTASSGSTVLEQGPALRDEIRRRPLLPAPSPGLPAGADPLADPARFYRVLWIR
jgi:hypothetical protein